MDGCNTTVLSYDLFVSICLLQLRCRARMELVVVLGACCKSWGVLSADKPKTSIS
jgi:hypothetical protein